VTQLEFMQMLTVAMAAFVRDLSLALDMPLPFTAEQLAGAVARWRHVRIDIKPQRMGKAKVYGLCKCVRPTYYVIFYRSDGTTYIQQQRIILHELCHIILSHVSPLNPVHALKEDLTVTLQDQEAETFAEIANRAALSLGSKLTVTKTPIPDREAVGALGRFLSGVGLKAAPASMPGDQFDDFLKVMGGQE